MVRAINVRRVRVMLAGLVNAGLRDRYVVLRERRVVPEPEFARGFYHAHDRRTVGSVVSNVQAVTDRTLGGPDQPREGLVDEGHLRRAGAVGRRESPAGQHVQTGHLEKIRADIVLVWAVRDGQPLEPCDAETPRRRAAHGRAGLLGDRPHPRHGSKTIRDRGHGALVEPRWLFKPDPVKPDGEQVLFRIANVQLSGRVVRAKEDRGADDQHHRQRRLQDEQRGADR